MKKIWLILTAIPLLGFAQSLDKDYLFLCEEQDVMLGQLIAEDECTFEEELSQTLGGIELGDFDNEEEFLLFGLNFEEDVEPLLPWSEEALAKDQVIVRSERQEYIEESKKYSPSFETVPKRSSYFALRPRSVPTKKENNIQEQNRAESKKETKQSISISTPKKKKSRFERRAQR